MESYTLKESYTVSCPKCGNILYVVGREIWTGDIFCTCHRVKTFTPVLNEVKKRTT